MTETIEPGPQPQRTRPRYDFQIDMESESTHAKVVRLVGVGQRVLEIGCATGYMSRLLRERGCTVVGVELDPDMAAEAAPACERVLVGDVEQMDLVAELGDNQFDVIVAADVLEHLRDPLAVLRGLKPLLKPDGRLVASIPNVAHGSVRLALLGGQFPYSDRGLLDATHLRFFTRASMQDLFEQAGFMLGHLERQALVIEASEVPYDKTAATAVLAQLEQDIEALTYQFIVVAYPLPRLELLLVQERMAALATALDGARREIARLQSEAAAAYERRLAEQAAAYERRLAEQAAHLAGLDSRIAALSEHEHDLRARLLDAHDQLVQRDEELQRLLATRAPDEVLERLRRERDEYRARLDRILASRPLQIYSAVQRMPGARRLAHLVFGLRAQ